MLPNRVLLFLSGILFMAAACQDSSGPVDPTGAGGDLVPARSQRSAAPDQKALARDVPGFGGVYVAEDGIPTVYLTDPSQRGAAQRAVTGYLQRHGLEATGLRVKQAAFDLEQLDRWFLAASPEVLAVSGTVYMDLDEANNRLTVGVSDPGARAGVRSALTGLGIPESAYATVAAEPIRFVATLRDRVRPVIGGLQIHFHIFLCTLGFNAIQGGAESFITNSHCTMKQGGVEDTEYAQPLFSAIDNFIGTEVADPPYQIGGDCPRGFRCRFSDSSRARYAEGVEHELGMIVRTEGPDTGSLEIDGTFRIRGETANPVLGQIVNKMGRTTGWTSGRVTATCVDTGVSASNFLFYCQSFVENDAGSVVVGAGDSGSPVFERTGGPNVQLHGILWGGNGPGTLFVYSPLSGIETELGPLTTN